MTTLLIYLSVLFQFWLPSVSDGVLKLASGQPQQSKYSAVQSVDISPLPVANGVIRSPQTAKSYLVMDLDSKAEIKTADIRSRRQVASLTKIMTAVVVLEHEDLERVETVPELKLLDDESRMGLVAGEKIKVRELLRGLLIPSGSDAARTLATNYSGGETAFIEQMNSTAKSLKLSDTHFSNSVGLDEQDNYSTVHDLEILVRYAMRNSFFKETVGKTSYTATSEDGRTHPITTTNQLLDSKTVLGIKTGRTELAGECLITLTKINGHSVLIVLLGSSDRFGETSSLITSLKRSLVWEK